MMHEVIRRRLQRLGEVNARRPDLILVDGGAGQVRAALRELEAAALDIPVAGLAKRNEEIHLPGARVVRLPRRSTVVRYFQRIRDEAHRFAVTYHRNVRGKQSLESMLDGIPGIGDKRKMQLLAELGSIENIAAATPERIATIRGIGPATAKIIHEHLHR